MIITLSMLFLGGLGACLPRKILKNRCSQIAFEGIFHTFPQAVAVNVKTTK